MASRHEYFALPLVETVSLEFHSCGLEFVTEVLKPITFSAASKLKLSLSSEVNDGPELARLIQVVFDDPTIFPTADTLELRIKSVDAYFRAAAERRLGYMNVPFSVLKNIRHLTLHIDFFIAPIADEDRIPPLRSLRLTGCSDIGPFWLVSVLQRLEDQGDAKYLEEVRIDACARIPDKCIYCRSIPEEDFMDVVRDIIIPDGLF